MKAANSVCPFAHSCALTPLLLVLLGMVLLTGCGLFEVKEDSPIDAIAIVPNSVSMAVGDQRNFSVVGLTASGDTVRDANFTLRWWSTDTTIFTVEENGLATGQGTGNAFCKVEATSVTGGQQAGKTGAVVRTFDGLDSASVHIF